MLGTNRAIPRISWQLNNNDWKQFGFLPQGICNVIIPVFSYPRTGPPFAWLDTDWDWIPQLHWLAPKRTYSLCGSDLWVWCPPGWIGRFTLGLAFTHGFTFSELLEKPANLPHLRTHWMRSVFHWYNYLTAIFIPCLGTTEVMLWVDAVTILKKLFQPLMLNKYKLWRWFYKTDWPQIF